MIPSLTAVALRRLTRPLRRWSVIAWAGAGIGGLTLFLGLLAWSVRLGWYQQPSWVLLGWGASGVILVGLGWGISRRGAAFSSHWLADRFEELGAWRRGSLRALLQAPASGTSSSLLAEADRRLASDIERRGPEAAGPLMTELRGRAMMGLGLMAAGLVAFTSAGPMRGTAAALWHPGRAWDAAVAPLRIIVETPVVDRGEQATFALEAYGRRRGILWLRTPGESWRGQPVELDSLGRGRQVVGPLRADLFARFTSGSRGSDTVEVKVRIPAFLGSLSITAHYPRYLGLEDEPLPTNGDTVLLPAGTRLETRGEATASLGTARWTMGAGNESLTVTGTRFGGVFTPEASGLYRLELSTAAGAPLAGDSIRLPLKVVTDSAPVVEVPVPGADTVAPLSLHVPLVVDARDDHGLTKVVVESRRISRLGFSDPARVETIPLPGAPTDRAILSFDLDLNQRGLLPGDSVRYFVRAQDNAPRANVTRSKEFVLRLATLSEVRAAARRTADAVAGRLDSITAQSRKLERQTGDLAQERARQAGDQRGQSDESLSFEAAKRAEAVAGQQEQLLKQAEAVKQSLEALQQSAEAAGLNDPEWQKQLDDIRRELDRALTPDLREKLAELQKALKDLDPERTKDALARLAEAQKELREALERSKELFRRAAIEGDMANLSSESKELAHQQEEWNRGVPAADSTRAAQQEKQLAERTDSLGAALERLSKELAPEGRQEAMQSASEQAQEAGQQMEQASQSARAGQRKQARKQGEQALQQLQPLSDQIKEERKNLQQEWRQEVADAVNRALAETSRLSQRQLSVAESFRKGDASPTSRAVQGAVEEGVERLLDQLKTAAGKNALVTAQASLALAAGREAMRKAREALSSPVPNTREAGDNASEAVDALNAAAYQLFRNGQELSGSSSGSGLEEAMEKMAQMASQQGQIGQQSGGLLPMAGNAGAIQEQLRRLAAQQRALGDQLERLRATGEAPGAGAMADEAKDLARRLEAGRLDRQTVERQEKLFRRMLDAGRTLQGKEEDEKKERQSTTATDDSIHLPPALRARLQGEDERLRLPGWDELQRLSPEERRLVVEYFRRLSEAPQKAVGPQ